MDKSFVEPSQSLDCVKLEEQSGELQSLKDRLEQDAPSSVVLRKAATPDSKGRVYATGKRKTAIARVWVKPGRGDVEVNYKPGNAYFSSKEFFSKVLEPFLVAGREGVYNVWCTVKGGGLSAQAEAVRSGIARSLADMDPTLRSPLKKAGFVKVDSRQVERKKPGQPKARKKFQFSKR
jgi:small subunit ribosomal protein S9